MIQDYIKAYKLLRNGRLKKNLIKDGHGLSLKESLSENREDQKTIIYSILGAFPLLLQLRKHRKLIAYLYSKKLEKKEIKLGRNITLFPITINQKLNLSKIENLLNKIQERINKNA